MSFLILFPVGLVGMYLHWLKRKVKNQTHFDAYSYFFKIDPKYSALSFFTYLGAFFTWVSTQSAMEITAQNIALVFLLGYNIDSALNKG